jgi:hypothetical protein
MIIKQEYRERLAWYCMVAKCTQEQAVNQIICDALDRFEQDPVMQKRMSRAKEIQEMLANL